MMVSSKTTMLLFTQLTSSRTGFLSTSMTGHTFLGHLNIIEPLWSTLEWKVRGCYPVPSSLSELTTALQEEWYTILLASIQELYLPIPRRLQAVLNATCFPPPY
ncbi:hypothetical protein FHG87_016467 [Trinorchestia longiramus]|nr:hypothetical protein FHG87_016467 [Trinorchestia longiramus]